MVLPRALPLAASFVVGTLTAVQARINGQLVFTTDSFVVSPLVYPF